MHATYHEYFHIVDDHNELRQGEAAMADVWGTRDWADRHFAEGLGLWEVNVYKAAVAFQGVTYHHSECRKRLALAFLTLGTHEWGTPLVKPTPHPPAQPGQCKGHVLKLLAELTGKNRQSKVCGYCGTESAYLVCITCFPDLSQCNYGVCSPNTGKDCSARHCAGELAQYFGHKVKMPTTQPRRAASSSSKAATAEKKEKARAAGSLGGQATQAAKKTKARH